MYKITFFFSVSSDDLKHKSVWLVLHGVDTIGEVHLNGRHILTCNNMFVRYNVNIKHLLVVKYLNYFIMFNYLYYVVNISGL